MTEKTKNNEDSQDETQAYIDYTWHYVIHVELVNPIQAGGHKRSYLRYNMAHNQLEVKNGVLYLPRIGGKSTKIPVENIVCWDETHVHAPQLPDMKPEEWRYVPDETSLNIDHPVGYYYSTVARDSSKPNKGAIAWIYDDSVLIVPPKG
jgi:hypothetical protein